MRSNNQLRKIERAFDEGEGIESHLGQAGEADPEVERYARMLATLRAGARALAAREAVSDDQFPAFWDGIQARLDAPPAGSRQGFWAFVSLAAAALIVAISAFLVLFGKTEPVAATTIVEEITTEIEGARITWYPSDDGATVYVNGAEKDVW